MVVGGVYKCKKMHTPKKKKRKSIKSVSPEPPKNRNSWVATEDFSVIVILFLLIIFINNITINIVKIISK